MMNCSSTTETGAQRMIAMNASCLCLPLDRRDIDDGILRQHCIPGFETQLSERPHLFAGTPIFLSEDHYSAMLEQIEAIEAAVELPAYRAAALSAADLANAQTNTRGVMMGYDFHITPDGPRLIEINTNAGGAFLVAAMYGALGDSERGALNPLAQTFIAEWRRARRSLAPRTLAIVDHAPREQYLYPDMLLAKNALETAGIEVIIADPSELTLADGVLKHHDLPIDMVYNRVTDFSLSGQASSILRDALLEDAAVISPAPRHHALYADKRNLTRLSDPDWLDEAGLSVSRRLSLASIPRTRLVNEENADELWAGRKDLFFKPAAGFGSRATYRGAKLTKRVWEDICRGGYVAQEFVPPMNRVLSIDGHLGELKFDLRVYTYDGTPLLIAARAYQGQTTNFRSAGGGFAPVIIETAEDA